MGGALSAPSDVIILNLRSVLSIRRIPSESGWLSVR